MNVGQTDAHTHGITPTITISPSPRLFTWDNDNLVCNHRTMLHTKYLSSMPHVFCQEEVLYVPLGCHGNQSSEWNSFL